MAVEKVYKALRSKSGDESDHDDEHKKGGDDTTCSRTFHPRKQLWKLLGDQMWRLIFTVVLLTTVLITFRAYKNKGTVPHTDKIVFNTIVTVLSLALGLNFLEAFKDMAKVLRWRVLANRKFSVRETDLILGGESLMNLVTLMRESMRKPLTLTVCICWIALNLLAQASVALIGLNYSMDKGQDSQSITTSTDNVMVPLLNCYYNNGTCTTGDNEPPEIAQNEAHSYGEITPGQNACLYTTNDDIFNTRQDCDYFINRNQHEFAYRFMEYNPDDGGRSYPYLTHRLIKASAGKCYQYTTGTPHNIASHNGPRSIRVWPYKNGTYNETIAIPISDTAFDSTTYAYLGDLEPQNAPLQRCGPRCIKLYAFRSGGPVTNRDEAVFQCPITISDVTNSTNQAHDVPNDVARMAAASIALTGRYTNLPGDAPGQKHWQQFQLYPLGSRWEIDGLEPDMVGARMSEFAIGSLTAMAKLNKKTQIQGTLPTLGYRLSIHWNYVLAIAISIAGVHCLLVGVILWIARPIVIPGDSTLITARLLQGLVGRVGDEGGLMGERELAAAIEKRGGGEGGDFEGGRDGKGTVGYGVEKQQGKTVLRIGSGMAKRKDLDEGKFPGGVYA